MMAPQNIDKYVVDLLKVAGYDQKNTAPNLYLAIYHQYHALAWFERLDADQQREVTKVEKMLKGFFVSRFFLKRQKKENKRNKENTPTPPLENKENIKEKKEKTHTYERKKETQNFDERKEAFRQECLSFIGKYDTDCVADFFNWYSEANKTNTKMRFESQRFWNTEKRLARWAKNRISSDNSNARIRLRKVKAKETKETEAAAQQQVVAAVREKENAVRAAEREEAKQKAGGLEETMNANPNGFLAKVARERAEREARKAKKPNNS